MAGRFRADKKVIISIAAFAACILLILMFHFLFFLYSRLYGVPALPSTPDGLYCLRIVPRSYFGEGASSWSPPPRPTQPKT